VTNGRSIRWFIICRDRTSILEISPLGLHFFLGSAVTKANCRSSTLIHPCDQQRPGTKGLHSRSRYLRLQHGQLENAPFLSPWRALSFEFLPEETTADNASLSQSGLSRTPSSDGHFQRSLVLFFRSKSLNMFN
jgi:hypothetical protein